MTSLRLNPQLDLPALAAAYAANSRVRIPDFLAEEGVVELYHHLRDHDDWWQLINTGEGVLELDREARAGMTAEQCAALDGDVFARAATGFQYRYEALRVPEEEEDEDDPYGARDPFTAFAKLMSSEPMLAVLRAITGCQEISFTDGQATAYGPGDFLTGHDDDVPGKNRLAAYVFGMTPRWRPEWGGLLLFHGADEGSVTGLVPRFNTLDLFAVPQRHSVSLVTPSALNRRFAVTGWLRNQAG